MQIAGEIVFFPVFSLILIVGRRIILAQVQVALHRMIARVHSLSTAATRGLLTKIIATARIVENVI